MPLFGAHLSVSDGYKNMFETADSINCRSVQIFSKNQRRWESKPMESSDADFFKKSFESSKVRYVVSHASYLLNLASGDNIIWNKSLSNLLDDMERCSMLGIGHVVFHPGAHLGDGEEIAIKRVSKALNILLSQTEGVEILIETTAGQGTNIGYRFEHLRDIIAGVKDEKRVFVCYDTAHTFAAGYDIRNKNSYEKTFKEFDSVIGLNRLKAFHINDSKADFESRKDRHEFIGRGFLGEEPFRMLAKDKRFKEHPMILEVPGDVDEFRRDIELMNTFAGKN